MATETVRDYLGHPCQTTEAMGLFSEPLAEARKLDRRELARAIGRGLMDLKERESHLGNALVLARDSLNEDNVDEVLSLLALAASYDRETGHVMYELAGQVLAALERGNLVEVAHV